MIEIFYDLQMCKQFRIELKHFLFEQYIYLRFYFAIFSPNYQNIKKKKNLVTNKDFCS